MWTNKKDYSSFNFKAPEGMPESSINEPLFPVTDIKDSVDLSVAVPIKQMKTIIDFGTLTAAKTINLDIDSQVSPGAILQIKAKSGGTARTITLGTGLLGPNMTGTINKTKAMSFLYNGTAFVAMAAAVQLD